MTTSKATSEKVQSSQVIDMIANQRLSALVRPWLIYYPHSDYLEQVPVLTEIDGQELCVISGYALVGDCGWSGGKSGRTVRVVCEKALSLGFTLCTFEIAKRLAEMIDITPQNHPLHDEDLWVPTQPIDSTENYLDIYLLWNNLHHLHQGNLRLSDYGKKTFADDNEGSGLYHWVFVKTHKQETVA